YAWANTGALYIQYAYDDDWGPTTQLISAPSGWHYLAMGLRRATTATAADGWFDCWLDGARIVLAQNIDNYHRWADLEKIVVGNFASDAALAMDFDEIAIADQRPAGGLSRYHLYRSAAGGSRGDIDFSAPVATIPPGLATRDIAGLGHASGSDYWYALRAVSDSGVEERNTHVQALVRLNAAGKLAPPMAAPRDVTAGRRKDGAVIVGFSYRVADGWPCPDAFDIFTDGGTGTLDLDHPLVSLPGAPRRREYEAIIVSPALPARFAVRPRTGPTAGPISSCVTVATAAPAQPIPF
ncbi:MAG: hypothetical protein ACE15C_20660, partial [Phycisphaerae bacterium]